MRSELLLLAIAVAAWSAAAGGAEDIASVPADLVAPPMTSEPPGPGRRVRQVAPEYAGAEVYHALYLPTDWRPGGRYPVLVEYAGNGPYQNAFGDASRGDVEGSSLGYGVSAGRGFLWLCLPYVNSEQRKNQLEWWGDPDATAAYCRQAVRRVCEDYGGDPAAVILLGFSRGAIACGYLGLRDDATADIWLAMVAYSHFDGVYEKWPYAGADRASARERLRRLKGRAVFVCSEDRSDGPRSLAATKRYLEESSVLAPFTFQWTGFRNHNDAWILRPSPARDELRRWLRDVLARRPGTHATRGKVLGRDGQGLAGARVESGETHFTLTDASGSFELAGLVDGGRLIRVEAAGLAFALPERLVELRGGDLEGVDFTARR